MSIHLKVSLTLCLFILLLPFKAQLHNNYRFNYAVKTIVIDAGHGGHDSGCHGTSAYEKNVTLSIALKLGAMLEKNLPGVKIIYTRKTDEFIELYERAEIANRNKADLFVSIHCNANKNISAYGTETWSMGLHKTEGNLEVAKRENSSILLESDYQQNYEGFDPNSPEGYIMFSLNQNAFIDQSLTLAGKIEEEFESDGRESRGVKQAGFLVLWRTAMPSVLIETGFLTNRNEEKYLASEVGQNEVATSVYDAVLNYKNKMEKEVNSLFNEENKTNNTPLPPTVEIKPETNIKKVDPNIINNTTVIDKQKPVNPENKSIVTSNTTTKETTIYKIQVGASKSGINLKAAPYNKLTDAKLEKAEAGVTRVMVGNYSTTDDVKKRLIELNKQGFKDAFIVGYHNGERFTIHW